MANFRLRFRKTLPIIPKVFYITINKQSISWNLRLGPYSRTWGKDHTISTLDAPGTYGASWRKTQKREKRAHPVIWSLIWAPMVIVALSIFQRPDSMTSVIASVCLWIGGAIALWLFSLAPKTFVYISAMTLLQVILWQFV